MSEFTAEDFEKVAKEVAEHISSLGSAKIQGDISVDSTWEVKKIYASMIYVGYWEHYTAFKESAKHGTKFSDLVLDLKTFCKITKKIAEKPFFPSNSDHPLNSPDFLKAYFNRILEGGFIPSVDKPDDFLAFLLVFQLYYSAIGYHLQNVDIDTLFKMDFLFFNTAFITMGLVKGLRERAVRDLSRIFSSSQTIQEKWSPLDRKIQTVLVAEGIKPDSPKSVKILRLRNTWKKHFPGDPPGKTKLYDYFNKKENSSLA